MGNTNTAEITPEKAFYGLIGTNNENIEKFRLLLMFCACIKLCGFPTVAGPAVQSICGFAPIAFFILSGMLVLSDPEKRRERLEREIKRTATAFLCIFVFYVLINVLLFLSLDADFLPALKSKRIWFNFLVLNIWPFQMGDAVWYVQSLLYAYIVIYILERLNLLQYDVYIFPVLFIISVLTGEFSGLVHFNFLGYTYLPPNFFTVALPYLLLGGISVRFVSSPLFFNPVIYIIGMIAGVGLTMAEPVVLFRRGAEGYYSQLIGMVVVAVCLCFFVLSNIILQEYRIGLDKSDEAGKEKSQENEEKEELPEPEFLLTRKHTNLIYYLYQPVAMLLGFFMVSFGEDAFETASSYLGLVVFAILFLAIYAGRYFKRRRAIINIIKSQEFEEFEKIEETK